MVRGICWRKAMIISFCLHVVGLIGMGWMATQAFAVNEVAEQYVELELTSEPEAMSQMVSHDTTGNAGATSIHTGQPVSAAMPISTASNSPAAPSSAPARESVPSVQVSAGSMSMLSAETRGNSERTDVSDGKQEGGQAGEAAGTGVAGPGKSHGTGGNSGTGTSRKSSGVSSPGILSRVEPTYPEQARKAGREGTVVLKIQILESGRPGDVSLYRSSGSDLLDEAAMDAVRKWRFIPARDRGSSQPIVCYTTMPVVFRLNG